MSNKEKKSEDCARGCGQLFGLLLVFSLFFGLTGQLLKWSGQLEADWKVLWVPVLVLFGLVLLLFAFIGFVICVEKNK